MSLKLSPPAMEAITSASSIWRRQAFRLINFFRRFLEGINFNPREKRISIAMLLER